MFYLIIFLQRINLKVIKIFFNYYHSFFLFLSRSEADKIVETFFCSILCKTFLCHSYIYIIIYNRLDGKWHEWKKLQVIFEVYFGGKFWNDLCYSPRNWLVLVKYLWMDSSKIAPYHIQIWCKMESILKLYLPIKMTRDIRKINEEYIIDRKVTDNYIRDDEFWKFILGEIKDSCYCGQSVLDWVYWSK